MAITTRVVQLPRSACWAALCDGYRYAHWVVGTNKIRDVEAGFPAQGTALHYRLGWAPLAKDGDTRVQGVSEGDWVELSAQAWPVGRMLIRITLEGDDPTKVTIQEHPHRGPMAVVHNPLFDHLIFRRNQETLRRFEELAREHATGERSL